jgi:hypothetical protein
MSLPQHLSRDVHHQVSELVDRYHLLRADVERTRVAGAHQQQRSLDALVDEEEGAGLLAVAPDFNLAIPRFRHFSADRRRRLLPAAVPRSLRPENVVITGNAAIEPVIALEGKIEALAEQLLPSVFAVGSGRVGAGFRAVGLARVFLIVSGLDAGRR